LIEEYPVNLYYRSMHFVLLLLIPSLFMAQAQKDPIPINISGGGQNQSKALRINDSIFQAIGTRGANTFLVTTRQGNVIIDTSMPPDSALHKRLLTAENNGPVKYIILTYGHEDHIGGIPVWKQAGTQIIAQKNHAEFQHYMARLNGFYGLRNAAQFVGSLPEATPAWPGNYGAKIEPTILFDDRYEFELDGVKFVILSTPGETYDQATVWIPKYKAAFVGDNWDEASFPNLYTLRGTRPRWALDYVESLNKVITLKPEIILPGHGRYVTGSEEIGRKLTRYRDAIQYVHDETVKGMNAGKSVWTLMNEIKLPPPLELGESWGKVSWSVRGIYEGYVGWFDLNPATMYSQPVSAVYRDVVKLAGGAAVVANLAMERAQSGQAVEALHLSDIALAAETTNKIALQAKLKALATLRERSRNSNESAWLDFGINQAKQQLGERK
jgi:alkyl sulfatase BDS1-like metallo-beta-lactamase superfamily hydrolase